MINIRKTPVIVSLVVLMLFCSSCSQSDNSQKIDYSMFLEDQNTDTNDKVPTEETVDINTSAPAGEATGENVTTASQDTENDDILPWNWPSDMDFTGVKSEMKDFKLGNISSNINLNPRASCLFCPDKQNNVNYYINMGKDRFIYKLEGDKNTLLVEMQAHNLQLWDNKLYFININKTDYFASGPIYSYDLDTKKLEPVLDKNVALFYIDNFGIYYSELGDSNQLSVNLLDFNNKIISLENYPWVISYNEYLLTLLDGNLSLVNRYTDEIIKIMPYEDSIQEQSIHIYKDKLIFVVKTNLYVLDLITGDKISYNGIPEIKFPEKHFLEEFVDYAFMDNNIIYISFNSLNLIQIDLNKDEANHYVLLDSQGMSNTYLQTDGERLFALLSSGQYDPVTNYLKFSRFVEIIIPAAGNVLTRKEFGQ